jgi:enoyl-CoA hydratase/carnithine racemase
MNYEQYQYLEIKRDGDILRVTLNMPDKRNALDANAQNELGKIFIDITDDPAVRCVVLTGAGQSFSVGGDLPKMQKKIDEPGLFFHAIPNSKRIVNAILDCPKPIVARINGDAVGLGCTIALLSDIVIASDDAKIGDPHVRVGLVAGDGGSVIWPQLIGFARAKRYLLTGDLLTGKEAAQIGLITLSVPADQLDAEVEKWAARLAAGATTSIAGTKLAINSALKQLAATGIDVGMAYEGLSNISDDHQEALTAFLEKRKPKFAGN